MPLTWNAIFLGRAQDVDTDESDLAVERTFASGITVGSSGAPLSDNITQFTVDDADSDGIWDSDNAGFTPEAATIAGESDPAFIDSTQVYNATITYTDGSTAQITAVIFQLTDGRVFLAPEYQDNADNAALNAQPIQSFTIDSLQTGNTSLYASRMEGDFDPCFAAGTPILTPAGWRPVETLAPGDVVVTRDNGWRPLLWVGGAEVRGDGAHAPMVLPGLDGHAPLRLSPHHRVLVEGWTPELMLGAAEVLVPAKAGALSASQRPCRRIRYLHLLFDRHEIVQAAGYWAESLYLGDYARSALDPRARAEIAALCPDLPVRGGPGLIPARPLATVREGRALAA